jgi:SLOG family YspA-like protein
MRVLVCGGRNFTDVDLLNDTLNAIWDSRKITMILHGGAPGADTLASYWAELAEVPCRRFPAQWQTYGKRAGPIRNQLMLQEGQPDLVVAFHGGIGTRDMIEQAKRAGVPVQIVNRTAATTKARK